MGGRHHGGPTMDASWKFDLERWLSPFVSALRHKARARMCPVYVAGLIGAGDRKSVQPMAARDGEVGYDQLHHFIASGVWDSAPLENALLAEADRMVGGADAWLIVDDTALPKKGEHSVGVAPQYASSLGKTANCQSLVSLTLASREVPVMVGLRLFLPESWTDDPERMARARVPEDRRTALTKPEIAIEEIDRVIPKALVADSHGDSRIAAGLIQVGAGGFAPCLQRSDYERTIRRKSGAGWPAGRRTSIRADGFCHWQGFEAEWTEGRPRGSAAWTARRCAIGFTASTPRVRRGLSITGRKARSLACPTSNWRSLRRSSRLARSARKTASCAGGVSILSASSPSGSASTSTSAMSGRF